MPCSDSCEFPVSGHLHTSKGSGGDWFGHNGNRQGVDSVGYDEAAIPYDLEECPSGNFSMHCGFSPFQQLENADCTPASTE